MKPRKIAFLSLLVIIWLFVMVAPLFAKPVRREPLRWWYPDYPAPVAVPCPGWRRAWGRRPTCYLEGF